MRGTIYMLQVCDQHDPDPGLRVTHQRVSVIARQPGFAGWPIRSEPPMGSARSLAWTKTWRTQKP